LPEFDMGFQKNNMRRRFEKIEILVKRVSQTVALKNIFYFSRKRIPHLNNPPKNPFLQVILVRLEKCQDLASFCMMVV
jgi:hypothetical protein